MNPWAEPLKGILSEHSEQALMFIENSFQTTALTWILSLDKKAIKDCEKPHCVLNKKPCGWGFRTSRCALDGKDEKDYFIFIEGACDRFLSSDFPVLAQNRFAWMESRWESLLS